MSARAVIEKRGRVIGWGCLAVAAMVGVWLARSWVPAVGTWLTDWWPLPVTIVLAVAGVTVLELRRRTTYSTRPPADEDEVPPALSTRTIVAWSVLIGLVGVIVVVVLLRTYGQGEPRDQLDAIRTAGTILVGAGGAAILLLTARRQRSTELTLAHQHKVAATTNTDAAERRITELYTKAVEQLGSDKAPVRLGGLYALERLAQDNPNQQQTIVNVICAYLRMPYTPPSAAQRRLGIHRPLASRHPRHDPTRTPAISQPNADSSRQELEVRLAAQQILTDHLTTEPAPSFWKNIDINLTGATLVDFSLAHCSMQVANFRSALFNGHAGFSEAQFNGDARFDKAQFHGDAPFDDTQFHGGAWFDEAQFKGQAWFDRAEFHDDAAFNKAQFHGGGGFEETQFHRSAWFDTAQFHRLAVFGEAQFGSLAWFAKAQFHGSTIFVKALFNNHAHFSAAQFHRGAVFDKAQFHGNAVFDEAQFHDAARFGEAQFNGEALARGASFSQLPDLESVRFAQGTPREFVALMRPEARNDQGASDDGKPEPTK